MRLGFRRVVASLHLVWPFAVRVMSVRATGILDVWLCTIVSEAVNHYSCVTKDLKTSCFSLFLCLCPCYLAKGSPALGPAVWLTEFRASGGLLDIGCFRYTSRCVRRLLAICAFGRSHSGVSGEVCSLGTNVWLL